MRPRTIEQIDNRIERLAGMLKLLRAERRVAILRKKHRQLKLNGAEIKKRHEPKPDEP